MPKLPVVSGEACVKALEKLGFVRSRQRGSHLTMKKQTDKGEIGCVVPMHKEIATGTLKGILKQAGVTTTELLDCLK
jgi:predicted RNA binding protein YcfA (HicA-like mRNA interferase family)